MEEEKKEENKENTVTGIFFSSNKMGAVSYEEKPSTIITLALIGITAILVYNELFILSCIAVTILMFFYRNKRF